MGKYPPAPMPPTMLLCVVAIVHDLLIFNPQESIMLGESMSHYLQTSHACLEQVKSDVKVTTCELRMELATNKN